MPLRGCEITLRSINCAAANVVLKSTSPVCAGGSFQADCELLKTERDSLESEYESYKIRVHTVLKQQKSKSQAQEQKSEDEEKMYGGSRNFFISLSRP